MNERNMFIVQSNRKYLWRQTWIVNINWFACNVGLYFIKKHANTCGYMGWSILIKYLAIPLILVGCTAPVTHPPAEACSPRLIW